MEARDTLDLENGPTSRCDRHSPIQVPLVFAVALTCFSTSRVARGDDGAKIPTPVAFPSRDCLIEVELGEDPTVPLVWMIPFEDDVLGIHEVPTSRRVQTFAFCKDPRPDETLPNWINLEEAQGAVTRGEIDVLPGPEEVLSTSWWADEPGHNGVPGDCVWPIQTPAQRTPFTCAATADGIEWDATKIPPGPYTIRAYTYAPISNLWSTRAGVIRVSDTPPLMRPALAALLDPVREAKLGGDTLMTVRACLVGPAETSLVMEWALAASPLANSESWQPLLVQTESLQSAGLVSFAAPLEAANQAIYLRASASSPGSTARWWSYASGPILVSSAFESSAVDDGAPAFDYCGHDVPAALEDSSSGCTIQSQHASCLGIWVALVCLFRRRREGDDGAPRAESSPPAGA